MWAVFCHHTASKTSPANDQAYMWRNASDRPIGAIYLARDGRVTIGAAGATNCQGKGGPYKTSKGTIPADRGNTYGIAIEAANNGTGEQWPTAQQDAYTRLCKALCDAYRLDPARDICAHWEWTPGRKIDPAGNSRYATGAASWNMDNFRRDVIALTPTPEPPPPDPYDPPPPPTPGKDVTDMLPMIGKYPNHGVWVVSLDGGFSHRAIRNKDWANAVIAAGAIDARTKQLVTDWGKVADFSSNSEATTYLGTMVP